MKIKLFFKSLSYIAIYILLLVIGNAIIYQYNELSFITSNILFIIIEIIIIIPFIYIFRSDLKNDFLHFKNDYKKWIKTILKYWLIGLCGMMITTFFINIIVNDGIAPNEEANRLILNKYPIYMTISALLLSPIIEEILFRLNFKKIFLKKNIFIPITASLFAFMHVISSTSVMELLYFIPYLSLGITFSAIYYETNNIYGSILAHILHNALTLIIIFLGI